MDQIIHMQQNHVHKKPPKPLNNNKKKSKYECTMNVFS